MISLLFICFYCDPFTINHTYCFLFFFYFFFNRSYSKKIADLIFNELVIECKLWEELAMVVCHFRSGEMFDPCNKRAILQIGTVCILISQLYMLQAMSILKIFLLSVSIRFSPPFVNQSYFLHLNCYSQQWF